MAWLAGRSAGCLVCWPVATCPLSSTSTFNPTLLTTRQPPPENLAGHDSSSARFKRFLDKTPSVHGCTGQSRKRGTRRLTVRIDGRTGDDGDRRNIVDALDDTTPRTQPRLCNRRRRRRQRRRRRLIPRQTGSRHFPNTRTVRLFQTLAGAWSRTFVCEQYFSRTKVSKSRCPLSEVVAEQRRRTTGGGGANKPLVS